MLALRDSWFSHSDFMPFGGGMDAEIAELKTMTRVTKMRQQIECREEGEWMVVRDVRDEKAKGGTRKVTSYGRALRSVSRSYSGNIDFDIFNHKPRKSSPSEEVIIEYPEEVKVDPPKRIEIEEIQEKDEPKKAPYEEKEALINKKTFFEENAPINKKTSFEEKEAPIKKTSVVTLGKGNLILLDGEDSNFHVTGISKGKVADAVSTLERISGDKKVKKVGFSKTEVHFAPDSGRVNIVETDEKPPPNQVRRKRRPKVVKKDLPETYFGGEMNKKVKEHVFPVIREPSPLLSTTVASLTQEKLGLLKSEPPKNDRVPEVFDRKLTSKEKDDMSYLGNVSPKLNKLIQNSLLYDFQPKLKTQNPSTVIKLDDVKSTKINITEDFSSLKKEVKKEPLYANREIQKEKASFKVTTTPKPKPRTSITKLNAAVEKEKVNKILPERPVRKTNVIKSTEIKKEGSIKSVKTLRSSTPKNIEPPRRTKIKTEPKVQKVIKTDESETPGKKIREPLRSFEKVSNGWVGHCIVPLKTEKVTPKTGASVQNTGVRRTEIKGVKNLKTTLATNKFSLSKEHLISAKLVKEISKDKEQRKIDLPRSKVESRVGLVSRRRMRYEDSNMRSRRDSDRSDDSVVKADEEVRAYMFHTKHKVHPVAKVLQLTLVEVFA